MDFRAQIYKEIDQAIDSYVTDLITGYYGLEEYKKVCGQIAGLRLAKNIIEETYRKYIGE